MWSEKELGVRSEECGVRSWAPGLGALGMLGVLGTRGGGVGTLPQVGKIGGRGARARAGAGARRRAGGGCLAKFFWAEGGKENCHLGMLSLILPDMRETFKLSLAAVAAGAAIFMAAGHADAAAAGGEILDGAAAFVNGEAVTISAAMAGIAPQLAAMAADPAMQGKSRAEAFEEAFRRSLDDIINRRLILQSYKASEMRLPENVLNKACDEIIETRYGGSLAALNADLERNRLAYADWKKIVEEQQIIRAMRHRAVNANVSVSPNEVRRAYEARKEEFSEPALANILICAVDDGAAAAATLASFASRLAAGARFEELAIEISVDAMAENGGDYGWIQPAETLARPLAAAALALADGEISEPVALASRRYLVFRRASRPGRALTLRETVEKIETELREKEIDRLYGNWIARLREDAAIQKVEHDLNWRGTIKQ